MHKTKMIAIDGPDLSGKSTLVKSLVSELTNEGYSVKQLHFPREKHPIGKAIYELLASDIKIDAYALQSLYAAEMHDFCKTQLDDLKMKYDYIILDRYYYSTMVYSDVLGLNIEKIAILSKDIVRPDLFINITSDIAITIQRLLKRTEDGDRFEKNFDFMSKIIKTYENIESLIDGVEYLLEENFMTYKPFNENIVSISTKENPNYILSQALKEIETLKIENLEKVN